MESSYLTVEFFRKIHFEQERGQDKDRERDKDRDKDKDKDKDRDRDSYSYRYEKQMYDRHDKQSSSNVDRYSDHYLKRIGIQFPACFSTHTSYALG